PKDANRRRVVDPHEIVARPTLIVPWPTVYETLRTRFVRRPAWVAGFDQRLKRPNVRFVDDRLYHDRAYALTVEFSKERRPISMVDVICRLILEDPARRIDYVLTTNAADFVDVCKNRGVEIISP
ncbi:MAG: hypothetical protein ACRDD1_10690, partial [Planctomycetia bacterium]